MYNLEKAKRAQLYTFNWEVQGYDCRPYKIRSPTFRVNFEVTEWQMELDLSKRKNIESYIPFRLERKAGIGPPIVTFDVKIMVTLGGNKTFGFGRDYGGKSFGEVGFWDFLIEIPSESLESDWLSSKSILICLEMKRSQTDSRVPIQNWYGDSSLIAVEENLKTLLSVGNFHDLDLKVNGKTFKLHKCILNARWPKLMSTLNFSKTSAEVETEAFSGVPHVLLEKFFQFAYCGDFKFMHHLDEIEGGGKVFNLIEKHNLYRLNDSVNKLPLHSECTQTLQSYRNSVEMRFTNVKSSEYSMGVFKTCAVPQEMHIGDLDLMLFVNKDEEALGCDWLKFSIIVSKLPPKNPVSIKCKLYIVGENNFKTLLTEQCLVLDKENEHIKELSSSTPLSQGKESKRYQLTSKPVITWKELIDEQNNFVRKRTVDNPRSREPFEEKDIYFEFQLKLADGENIVNQKHRERAFYYKWDYKIFEDLKLMCKDEKFTDIKVTSRDGRECVKANKAILATRSKAFKAILEKRPELEVLKLDIEPDYLKFFVHYLYTGQIKEVPSDKIDHLLSVADKYDMNCLKEVLGNQSLKRKMSLEKESSCNKKLAT